MIRLFLAGDVMLGRGIDQILRHPSDPQLWECSIHSALDYVRLAECAHGPIPRNQGLDYVWGDALVTLTSVRPDVGVVNLETSITDRGRPEPKGINYRMAPSNASEIASLGIDCCVLANNHVLDMGPEGLAQTLDVLHAIPVVTAGAGLNREEASAPAVIRMRQGRVLVFGLVGDDSGVPRHWSATPHSLGVNRVDCFDSKALREISAAVIRSKREGDLAVASIHWGSNWGYEIPQAHIDFAHELIDQAKIDLVHGHSSHHPKGWEIYKGKLILYGCGDFVNDYEGISGYEQYRSDLSLMYVPSVDPAQGGVLAALDIHPFQMRRFRLQQAAIGDVHWLCNMLNAEGRGVRARFVDTADGSIKLIGLHATGNVRRGSRP
jgi:poly-gamma-glutamate synthesis protein (capsule biosynthesis protein)